MTEPVVRPKGSTILGRPSRTTSRKSPSEHEPASAAAAADPVQPRTPTAVLEAEGGPPEHGLVAAPATPAVASRWALLGCVVFALAALVSAIVALQQRSALRAQQDQASELRDVAGRTIAALTSYDYQHLDDWKRTVLANATGSFQNQFESGFAGFEQTYMAEHNRATGAVQGVWVGPVEAGKATAVVLVHITVTSLTGTHPLEPYVQVMLLKVAGRWRVDDVQATFETSSGAGSGTTAPAVAPSTTATPPGSIPSPAP